MTRAEYEALRRDFRITVRAAWMEYQFYSGREFVASEKALALYAEYMERLKRAALALNVSLKQATEILNIGGMENE